MRLRALQRLLYPHFWPGRVHTRLRGHGSGKGIDSRRRPVATDKPVPGVERRREISHSTSLGTPGPTTAPWASQRPASGTVETIIFS